MTCVSGLDALEKGHSVAISPKKIFCSSLGSTLSESALKQILDKAANVQSRVASWKIEILVE